MFAPLKGYKTYIVGTLTILGSVAAILVGDTSIAEGLNLIIPALLGMTLRNGLPK